MALSRGQTRYMCSELVKAEWQDLLGKRHRSVVNLEEIWETGAELQFETPVPEGSGIRIHARAHTYSGTVTKSSADFAGYSVVIAFAVPQRWRREEYEPQHFLDPASLVENEKLRQLREKNNKLLKEIAKALSRPVV